ncbi:MAG: hypothetical protein GY753_15940, partial [Gammaproteobacteria bacterium]|nr:hypothetical protein [Gammaproteobacteria bacterium]
MPLLKRCMRGVGLVEIMVAMAIGLFLTGGLIQVYLANKRSYDTAEGLSRMQENLRFAAEIVAKDIRMAGFMPCRQTDKVANVVNRSTDTDWYLDFFNLAVGGYDGDHTDDDTGATDHGKAGIPSATGSPYTNHVTDTDIVVTLRGGEDSYSVVHHKASDAEFKLNTTHNLYDGDIVMVCDLTNAAILQISTADSSSVTIDYEIGGSPGNSTVALGSPVGTAYEYGPDSHLVTFSPRAYFIGTNSRGGRSLYRATLEYSSLGVPAMGADEVAEGIENMQLLFGVDTSGDNNANKYVRADEVLDTGVTWNDVVSVRL